MPYYEDAAIETCDKVLLWLLQLNYRLLLRWPKIAQKKGQNRNIKGMLSSYLGLHAMSQTTILKAKFRNF